MPKYSNYDTIKSGEGFLPKLWSNFLRPCLDFLLSIITLSAWYFLVVRRRHGNSSATSSNDGTADWVDVKIEPLEPDHELQTLKKTELHTKLLRSADQESHAEFTQKFNHAVGNASVRNYLTTDGLSADDAIAAVNTFGDIDKLFGISKEPNRNNELVIFLVKSYQKIKANGHFERLRSGNPADYNERLKSAIILEAQILQKREIRDAGLHEVKSSVKAASKIRDGKY